MAPFTKTTRNGLALGGKVASVGPVEFKKLVYDSKFTKLAEGMSFVNATPGAFPGLGEQDFSDRRDERYLSLS